jgi:hypothetical protein
MLPGETSENRRPTGICENTLARCCSNGLGLQTENGYIESFNGRLRDECLNVSRSFARRCETETGTLAAGLQPDQASQLALRSSTGSVCPGLVAIRFFRPGARSGSEELP